MEVSPNFDEFCELSKEYDLVALSVKLTADSETPLSAYSKLSKLKPTFLFESVVGGEQVSRFSFLGFSSSKLISCFQDYTEIKDHSKDIKIQTPDDPLKLIEDEIEGTKYHGLPGHRFSGGAIGYLSYEYASRIEPSIPVPEEDC